MPPLPGAGLPVNFAVPFKLSANVTPVGSVPENANLVADGLPGEVVTLNVLVWPTTMVKFAALVKTGGWLTVNLKTCVAAGAMPLFALRLIFDTPALVAAPLNVAVPLPLSTREMPAGNEPAVMVAVGKPLVLIVTA